MRAANRAAYLALSRQPIPWPEWGKDWKPKMGAPCETSLCAFCRLAECSGQCGDTEMDCLHPLDAVSEGDPVSGPLGYEPGHDCWGFRPSLPVEAVAEFVGQRLQGLFVEMPTRKEWAGLKPDTALVRAK